MVRAGFGWGTAFSRAAQTVMYSVIALGAGMGSPCDAHAFDVKLNRLADEFLHLVQRFSRSTKARQVGSVRTPACG